MRTGDLWSQLLLLLKTYFCNAAGTVMNYGAERNIKFFEILVDNFL